MRQAAQHLDQPGRAAPVDVVRRLIGAPAQDWTAPSLSIRARAKGLTAGTVASSVSVERSIVATWAMRGTRHFIAAEDYWWLVPLTAETSLPRARRRLGQLGVTEDASVKALQLIERVLAAEGSLTQAEIVDRLARRGIVAAGQATFHVIRLAALEGLACYGPDRNGEPTFVLARDWLGKRRPIDRDAAFTELARRYLTAYGPAAPEDFAIWSGLRASDTRRAWRGLGDQLVEVGTQTSSMWSLHSADIEPRTEVVRLIAGFDPYLLGWKSRRFALPERHERKVFPGGGILRPAIIMDGLVVGTWSTRRRGGRLVVTLRPFSRPSVSLARALADEGEDIGAFFEMSSEIRRE